MASDSRKQRDRFGCLKSQRGGAHRDHWLVTGAVKRVDELCGRHCPSEKISSQTLSAHDHEQSESLPLD